jgi:hypothetical protein
MGGVSRKYGGTGEVHTDLRWEGLRVENYLEDPGVEGTIILKWIF